jgi:flavin reductase (DIM6/NTAB) family NADH-FMN oxidoreductase RutF
MNEVITFDPEKLSVPKLHGYLLAAVAPRPIAFASTIDKQGRYNLSPFSFFNVFSANPPIMIFSPARRGRDNTTKHTYENVIEVPEVVINIVNYPLVQQVSLASTEYSKGVDEFQKAGLTPLASSKVAPPRVAESPVSFECRVNQVIPLGQQGGAGNLVISEVKLIHVQSKFLDHNEVLQTEKLDLVARMGGDWYCRASENAMFQVHKPTRDFGMGVDQLPESIRNSTILTGNSLGKLGNISKPPDSEAIEKWKNNELIKTHLKQPDPRQKLHTLAQQMLENDEVKNGFLTLLIADQLVEPLDY